MKKIRKMFENIYNWLWSKFHFIGANECQECDDILDDHTICETCDVLMCEEQDKHDVPWGWLCVDCFDSQYG